MKAVCVYLVMIGVSVGFSRASQADKSTVPPLATTFGKNAEVVVYARVVDSRAVVRAGSKQPYVTKGQGWAAIRIEIKKVSKGSIADNMTWIVDPQMPSITPNFVRDFPEGACFYFALRSDQELSKWCETDVFELLEMSPDTKILEANQQLERNAPSRHAGCCTAVAPAVDVAHP